MSGLRSGATLAASLALASPFASAGECVYYATPPAPPPLGAVVWMQPQPGSTMPNTVMLGANDDSSNVFDCAPTILQQARVISVAVGAALGFYDSGGGRLPWGAVNVGLSDPPPTIPPPDTTYWLGAALVMTTDPVDLVAWGGACPGCNLAGANITLQSQEALIQAGVAGFYSNFTGANLQGATLTGDGTSSVFSGADLSGATLNNVTLQLAQFNNQAKLRKTVFNFYGTDGTDFTSADLTGASFNVTIVGDSSFDQATLDQANFAGVEFVRTTFNQATVNGTIFNGADLIGAGFDGLRFQSPPSFANTTFSQCTYITNSNLLDVPFTGVSWFALAIGYSCASPGDTWRSGPAFEGSQLSIGALQPLLAASLPLARNGEIPAIDWTGAQLVASAADRAALAGADLRGVNLAGVNFLGEALDLTGTHFDGANLSGAGFALARLAGATFANVSAPGISFEDADLSGDGPRPGANFSGPNTNLEGSSFANADISGASFVGADLTRALFPGARGIDTDFSGVRAAGANFASAHLYGNGQAFNNATDLQAIDFSGAVLAGDVSESGGFDFTGADLRGARFDGTACIDCNFTNAFLDQSQSPSYPGASLTGAYLPGVQLAGAQLAGAALDGAWLYCGNSANSLCQAVSSAPPQWAWPLALGSGEAFGPVRFGETDLTNVSLTDVAACPEGKPGSTPPVGCSGYLLPSAATAPAIPEPCSASAHGACPTPTATLFDAADVGVPLAIAAAVPPTWNTTLTSTGYYGAFDDGTIRLVNDGAATPIAGTPGQRCPSPTSPCGDGGPATSALLGSPSGLAVGLDGSLYVADSALLRVRRIDPCGAITTVAGTGAVCMAAPCGDGGPATSATLAAANGIEVDTHGVLLVADGTAGVRRVGVDGAIATLAPSSATGHVVSVVQAAAGPIYAATRSPDRIIAIDPGNGNVTPVVGTGTSGYNGNSDPNLGLLLPGTEVQINQPAGLSVDLDGNVLFADSGNHLIRAYVPSSTHVIDDLAGSIVNGAPQSGYNGDQHWANETELDGPLGVTATRGALLVVADSGNRRIRQVGPSPINATLGESRTEAVLTCRPGPTWSCRRRPLAPGSAVTPHAGFLTIRCSGSVFATGHLLSAVQGRKRFLITEQRPLVPGWYQLTIERGKGKPRELTVKVH